MVYVERFLNIVYWGFLKFADNNEHIQYRHRGQRENWPQLTLIRQMRQRKQARDYQSKTGSNTQHWDQEETDMET